MEPQSGAHSDFQNSFGSSVLGSSQAGSSVNWESYSAIDAVSTTFLEPDRAETYLAKPGLLYEDLLKQLRDYGRPAVEDFSFLRRS